LKDTFDFIKRYNKTKEIAKKKDKSLALQVSRRGSLLRISNSCFARGGVNLK